MVVKKIKKIYILCILSLCICVTGCNKAGTQGKDNTPSQQENASGDIYKSNNSCMYYSVLPSSEGTYIEYFDYNTETAVPLCSDINCKHYNEECESYFSEDECLGGLYFQHDERIYMVERAGEKDLLVSYDKYGREKRTDAVLADKDSLVGINNTVQDMIYYFNGKIYYIKEMTDNTSVETNIVVCCVDLRNQFTIHEIDKMSIKVNQKDNLFRFINNSHDIYMVGLVNGDKTKKEDSKVYCIKIVEDKELVYMLNEERNTFEGKFMGVSYNWKNETVIDDNENIYFTTWEKLSTVDKNRVNGRNVVIKYNLNDGSNSIIYELPQREDACVIMMAIQIGAIDANHMYVEYGYTSLEEKESIANGSGILVLDHDGKEVNNIIFTLDHEKAKEYNKGEQGVRSGIVDVYSVDDKYLYVKTDEPALDGIYLSETVTGMSEDTGKSTRDVRFLLALPIVKVTTTVSNSDWLSIM